MIVVVVVVVIVVVVVVDVVVVVVVVVVFHVVFEVEVTGVGRSRPSSARVEAWAGPRPPAWKATTGALGGGSRPNVQKLSSDLVRFG